MVSVADRPGPVRRHRFAFAFITLVVATLFVGPLMRDEVFVVRDHFDYFQPLRWFTAEELRAGRLPLWNPYSGSGEPWLANPQTGVFYPPAWLFLILPFASAYMLYLMSHLVLLGTGAYLLFARRSAPGAALVGAVALTLSGPILSTLDVSNNLATLAWIPLALWCAAEGAWRRGGAALALAFLGGEPFLAAVGALLYALTALTGPRGERGSARLRRLVLAGALAAGLSAIQLLPFLESLRGSDRTVGLAAEEVLRDSMPLRDWSYALAPAGLLSRELDPRLGQSYIPVVYLGVLTALLAIVGITAVRRERAVTGWILLLVSAAALASGPAWLVHLPVNPFRYPARLVILVAFAIAALAAIGWNRVRSGKRWLDLLVVLVLGADLLLRATPLLGTAPFLPHPVPFDPAVGAETKIFRSGPVEPRHRAAWIAGYLNLYDRRFDAQSAAPVASAAYARLQRRLIERPDLELLEMLGIGWVLASHEIGFPFEPVARSGTVHAFRLREPTLMASHRSATAVEVPAVWSVDTSQARVTVDAPVNGVLVLRQRAAPGWRVTVNGRAAEAVVVDDVFRGVEVPEGRHEIVWTYRPPLLISGAAATLATLLALAFSILSRVRRTSKGDRKFSS